jgi:hypothetical protein
MSDQTLVYSDTSVTSTDNVVSIGRHTSSIKFYNASNTTDAVIEINGGPLRILIPSTAEGNAGYVELYGDYTKFQVITSSVTIAVMAFG